MECEIKGLRTDASKPGDVFRQTTGALKDIAVDVCISSCTRSSALKDSANDPDAVAKEKEQYKYKKDDESVTRLQSSNSIRFVPATMNQFGRRGPHFEALLREFAAELVTRPAGCKLMKGPYK